MGAVRNLVEGAANHADNVLESYKQNPERAVLGINTPYETKVWNEILGTNYQPNQSDLLTQGTVMTQHDRDDAAAKGINLGSTKGVDAVAQAAASYFGGQALAPVVSGAIGGTPAAGSSAAADSAFGYDPGAEGVYTSGPSGSGVYTGGGATMPPAVGPSGSQGVEDINNAQAGSITKGISDSQLQGSPFVPTPTGGVAPTQTAGQQAAGGQQQAAGDRQAGVAAPQGPQTPPTSTQPGASQQPGMVEKILQTMKNNPLATAGTALLGAQMLGGKPKMPEAAQQQNVGAQEAQATAQQLLAQYRTGALSPGQQASLDQLTNQTKNQLRQYFASIGQADSTAATQALAQVDSQALQMKQQMLDNALQQGLQAIGISGGQFGQIAQMQLGQDRALNQAFSNFAGSLGNIAGSKSGTETTVAPTISSTQAQS